MLIGRMSALLVASLLAATSLVAQGGSRPGPQRRTAQAGNKYGLSRPLPRTPGAIRLATYNMLNLFDHQDDPALQGEHDDIKMVTSHERCLELAKAVRATDADIIAMQEIESLQCLLWFRDTYLADCGYTYYASFDVGYYRGVECSVLSRYEITDARVWPDARLDSVRRIGPGFSEVPPEGRRGLKFQRSPLAVEVRISDDYALTVLSVHHKAGGDYRWQREAEALRIVELIQAMQKENPARNIVVMGDFNAAPWDKSFRIYEQAGMVDTLSHRIIPRWRDAPQDEANLYKTHESGRVLDYILLNSAAYREFIVGSAHVYGTKAPPDSYDWRKDPFPPEYASDHYPVMIELVPKDTK